GVQTCALPIYSLRKQAVRSAEKVRGLAQVRQPEHEHENARQTHSEATVGGHSVTEEVEVEVELLGVESLLLRLLDEHVDAVLALGSRGDLDAVENEVVAGGDASIRGITHVVERPDARRIVGEEHEVVPERLLDVGRDLALALRIHVVVVTGN